MLLKSEVKELHQKVKEPIRLKLEAYLDGSLGREWTAVEIQQYFGLPNNRISELRNPEKYPDPIGKPLLKTLIARRFITVKEITKDIDLNKDELAYLEKLAVFESKPIQDIILEAMGAGISEEEFVAFVKEKIDSKKS